MTAYGEILGDALDEVATVLARAARDLRALDDEPDDRRRASSRERSRRYRARRGVTRDGVTGDALERDASRVTESTNSLLSEGPSRSTDLREVGRRDEVGPVTRDGVTRDASRDATRDRDAQPSSPWRIDPPTDDEREAGQARVRELRDALREMRRPT